MSVEYIIGFAVLLFVSSLIAEPISRWVRLPHSALLVVLGALVAYVVTKGFEFDTGLRAGSFHDLIFFAFLPVLVFEAAFKVPLAHLREELVVVLFLAIVGMLLTTLIGAVLLYVGIGHPSGFPWIAALLAGALLAATDPVAVVAQLKTLSAPERLGVMIEGESLFNDATAIVLFSIFLNVALMPTTEATVTGALWKFIVTFIGGGLIGGVVGIVAMLLMRRFHDDVRRATITLTAAYGAFLLAEGGFHVSGVMASLVAGLIMAWEVQHHEHDKEALSLDFFWSVAAYLANGCVFLLMGFTVTVAMFEERWLAMLIAIVAVFFARALAIFGGLGLLNPFLPRPVPMAYQTAMTWGGLRGAITLALALSLPTDLPYWWTIQSMAFGVVLFTLLLQAPLTPALLRKLKLTET